MKKTLSGLLLAAAAFVFSAPAHANCGSYQPGMLAFVTGVRPAPCPYQGDYMVNQGPMYDGPARIAPQPTYAPARTSFAGDYPYVPGQYTAHAAEAPVMRTMVRRDYGARRTVYEPVRKGSVAKRTAVKQSGSRKTVNVKNELSTKGRPKVVHARAEVRIYSTERMDIRLYRR
jgi:hypothetical protein